MTWITQMSRLAADDGIVARAVLIATVGPTPRSVGASLLVTPRRQEGRIGRPEMMAEVAAAARLLIDRHRDIEHGRAETGEPPPWLRTVETWRTGEVLGESSGGHVDVLIEVFGPREIGEIERLLAIVERPAFVTRVLSSGAPPDIVAEHASSEATRVLDLAAGGGLVIERIERMLTPFHVYGTGLVARALVKLLAELPFDVTWHDRAPAHFPQALPSAVRMGRGDDPSAAAAEAPPGSFHAVMTNDHAEDLAVCRALARTGTFGFLGVIGAPLKRQRLLAHLAADGIEAAVLDRISCPIGLPGIRSKDPAVIAVSVAAQGLIVLQEKSRALR